MTNLKIKKINKSFTNKDTKQIVKINIFSNINVSFMDDIFIRQLSYNLLKAKLNFFDIQTFTGIRSNVEQDRVSIIFWELFNIFPKTVKIIKKMKKKELIELSIQIKKEIRFFLDKITNHKKIFFNLFSNHYLKYDLILYKKSNYIIKELNHFLFKIKKKNENLTLINLDIPELNKNYNLKSYYKTRSIYNYDFILNYCKLISPKIASIFGKIKKVLILDCDNTLWQGVVGENKINYSQNNKIGKIFFEAQKKFRLLKEKGVIICLCSKNNYKDVNKVIKSNKKPLLTNSDITLKKINWNNKASNIIEISKQLNLDPSSFIFLDDSNFELKLIKKYLPDVLCLKVPENLKKYNDILFEIQCYFDINQINKKNKTLEYKKFLKSENLKKKFNNIDDYIKSLKIKIYHRLNSKKQIKRMSQMCLKINQFNFTTKRYTENEIKKMIIGKQYDFHTFLIKDIFGNSGITGLLIIKKVQDKVFIDNFLMSCRILGRKIELRILQFIMNKYRKTHRQIFSTYIKTNKNQHIQNFFSDNFFTKIYNNKNIIKYKANLNSNKFLTLKSFSEIYE